VPDVSEQQLIAWFAVHPFTRSVVSITVGALAVAVKHDYNDFKEAQKADPTLRFDIVVAVQKYGWSLVTAAVVAVGPTLIAEVIKILGGGVLTP
jgi:hypothetical protein